MNSTKLQYPVDTIFMNSENSKTTDPHRLLLNLPEKINLKSSVNYVKYALSIFSMYYTWKNIKSSCKSNKFKISALIRNDKIWVT